MKNLQEPKVELDQIQWELERFDTLSLLACEKDGELVHYQTGVPFTKQALQRAEMVLIYDGIGT